jgi:hypothetical protein
MRPHRTIPKGVAVHLALQEVDQGLSWRQSQMSLVLADRKHQKRVLNAQRSSYKVTLGIGNVMFRIAYFPLSGYECSSVEDDVRCLWPQAETVHFGFPVLKGAIDAFNTGPLLVPTSLLPFRG